MVKILHLVSTFQIKTDTKWLLRLLTKFDRRRFDLVVGAFYHDGPARSRFEQAGIPCHCLNVRRTIDPRSLTRPGQLIRQINPDIVHTHLLRADLFGGLAARKTGTTAISTIYAHGHYRRAKRRPLLDGLIDRITTRLPHHFIAVCNAIKDDLVHRLGVPEHRITVIHTGIDPPAIDPDRVNRIAQHYHLPTDRPIVIVPARLSYEKGVDCFLHAVRQLVDRNVQACFLIAGAGPLETILHQLCRRLKLADHVRFLGFVEDLEPLLAAADVVVMPSYSEGLPNVALETFAAGTPLVAAAVGGLVDLAHYQPTPLQPAKPNDPTDLADNIQKVLTDADLAKGLTDAGRHIINQSLDTHQVAKRYENLYLERHNRRRP